MINELNGMNFEVEEILKKTYKFKVGDKVKMLLKEYSNYVIKFGIIVAFDNFNGDFVVTVAYIDDDYSKCELKIKYITKDSDVKLLPSNDEIDFKKEYIIEKFNNMISEKEKEIDKIRFEKNLFIKQYGKYIESEEN